MRRTTDAHQSGRPARIGQNPQRRTQHRAGGSRPDPCLYWGDGPERGRQPGRGQRSCRQPGDRRGYRLRDRARARPPVRIAVDGDRVSCRRAPATSSPTRNGGHRTPTASGSSPMTRPARSWDHRHRHVAGRRRWACSASRLTATPAGPPLYVADMNGRILRLDPGQPSATPELFSKTAIQGGGDWMASMWNDLLRYGRQPVRARRQAAIWRVTPDGTATIWVTDPRLRALPLRRWAAGRPDRPHRRVALHLHHRFGRPAPAAGLIYRIRLVDAPTAADIELVHVFPCRSGDPAAADRHRLRRVAATST